MSDSFAVSVSSDRSGHEKRQRVIRRFKGGFSSAADRHLIFVDRSKGVFFSLLLPLGSSSSSSLFASAALRAGDWRGSMSLGHDPEGKTLGMGGIGSALALRAVAFDLKVQYHNRQRITPESNPTNAKYMPFETLLITSDVISVHLPLSNATRHLIGPKEFVMMKNGVSDCQYGEGFNH